MRASFGLTFPLVMALLPAAALADGPKVEVNAEVVLASNKGTVIDPPELSKMKAQFAQSGLNFTSFRRLKQQRLALTQGQPARLELPNQKSAAVKLESLQGGTARVRVEVVKLVNTTVTLGREGAVFMQAGDHEGGKLVLVLSPAKAGKP